jgi:c-di-GMP-binding flagellar brake protein YcgR
VALSQDVKFEQRARHIRSTGRLDSRVPVAVEGTDAGRPVRAEGHTRDISRDGCMAVLSKGFAVGEKVRLVNLLNQNSCEAILIWRGHEGPAGWELGLEMQEPFPDFWGLYI